jgi:hypothetical protein
MSSIQAIGRCAASIPEVTATCLSGLVHLMSSSDQVTLSFLQVTVVLALAVSRTFGHFLMEGEGVAFRLVGETRKSKQIFRFWASCLVFFILPNFLPLPVAAMGII